MSIDRGHGIATSSVLADSYDLDALIADTEAAKVAALAAQVAAETAETNSETAETNSAASAVASAASAASITGAEAATAASAAAASASETAAATSETNASTSETNAGTSETNAGTSAANASTSETNASTSETNASNSASSASTSASTATTQASNASTSATNAASSETNAANSATAAATSETNIGNAEANCASSATSASSSASSATTSAAQASTSATSASNSATTATTKASEASTSATNAATSATNAATSLTTFQGQYVSQATAPTSPTIGDLWFDTTAGAMKVYGASGWQNAGSSVNGIDNSVEYTATSGQTSFTATYDPGFLNVFLNGVKLDSTDYTATNGSTVVLDTGAALNDSVFIQSFGTFELADHYSKTASDARFLGLAGGTMTGDVSLGDNVKANFGASDDLQIYHSGTTSWIRDIGTGDLVIDTNGSNISLKGSGPTETMARFFKDGAVQLYHNNSQKLATTSTGIDVTGSVLVNHSTNAGISFTHTNGSDSALRQTSTGSLILEADTGNETASSRIEIKVDGTERMRVTTDGLTFNGDTAAANALDDYEEGTFTPAYYSSGGGETVTHDLQQGRYTKVGDLVTIHILLGTDAISGGSSNCRIAGLPFTASQTTSTSVGLGYAFLSTSPRRVITTNGLSSLQLYPTHGSATQLPWASLNTGVNDNRLYITMSYWAT